MAGWQTYDWDMPPAEPAFVEPPTLVHEGRTPEPASPHPRSIMGYARSYSDAPAQPAPPQAAPQPRPVDPKDPFGFLRNHPKYVDRTSDGAPSLDLTKVRDVVLHDRGGKYPGNSPYHLEVLPDGSIVNHWRANQKEPHAYKFNPYSLGVAYGGKVGETPTPEALETLKFITSKLREQNPDWRFRSHGEVFQDTRGTEQQASRDGRGLEEASWRANLGAPPVAYVERPPGETIPPSSSPSYARSATATASPGPVASASPRSKTMADNSGDGFMSWWSKPMDLFGNPVNKDIMDRAGPQGYQPVDAAEFIKRHPALKGVEGVDQLVAVSNLQRDLMSNALKPPQATWGQGIGELLKGVGATLTSRVDPKLAMTMAGTVGQNHREQQDLVKKMQMQALLQQTQALGGDLGDVIKTSLSEERKRKADREKMMFGEYGVVPPSLSGSPVSPGTAAAGAVPREAPALPSATAAPAVPGTVLGTPPPGLVPTPPAGSVPAAPGLSPPGNAPTTDAASTGAQRGASAGVPDPIQDNLEKARRYLIMGDVARAKEYQDRAKFAHDQKKYDDEVSREVEKQKALAKVKSDQADDDKSRSRDQTRSNLNFSLDALEALVNSENIEGAIGPLEGNEYVQRLKAAIPFTSGKDFELNQRIKQQTGAIRAQLGSGLFKGEGPLSEGERAMASQIMGDLEFASTSDSFKKLINDARPLFDKIMRWEAEGRPSVSAWTDPNDPRKRPQTSTGQDKPTAASTGQAKPAPVSTTPAAYLSGIPENKPITLSSGRTVVRRGTQLFEVSPEEAAKMAPLGSAPVDPSAFPVSP